MSLSFLIFRVVSGSVLFVVGFVTGQDLFAQTPLFNIPYFGQTLLSFVLGAAGLFIFPYLVVYLFQTAQKWLTSLIAVTVQTTVARSMGSFLSTQAGKFKDQNSRSNPSRADRAEKIRKTGKDLKDVPAQGWSASGGPIVLLDTSVIIDGRIFDVIKSGFLSGNLIVPVFVVAELQGLADSADGLKRQRGRRGLDLLSEAKKNKVSNLSVWEGEIEGIGVDDKLTKLARKLKAKIATVDYNLNKVASVSGVAVLNLNDLSNLVRSVILPGEKVKIKVIQEGKEASQGVGYLPDGTMIVVENGRSLLGQEVEAEVSRLLQSSAGKMIFAKNPIPS